MTKQSKHFEHESLQDKENLIGYLKALTEGLEKGEIVFADEEETLVVRPNQLGRFKIRAHCNKKSQDIRLKISWAADEPEDAENQPLFIKPKKAKHSAP